MAAEELDPLLLRRRQAVVVEPSAGGVGVPERRDRRTAEGLTVLEAELADRAHVLTARLRRALAALTPDALAERAGHRRARRQGGLA